MVHFGLRHRQQYAPLFFFPLFNSRPAFLILELIDIKFMLLHDTKNEENIKNFFTEVHEFYIKVLMNPFHKSDGKISSKAFDTKIKQLGKKYL